MVLFVPGLRWWAISIATRATTARPIPTTVSTPTTIPVARAWARPRTRTKTKATAPAKSSGWPTRPWTIAISTSRARPPPPIVLPVGTVARASSTRWGPTIRPRRHFRSFNLFSTTTTANCVESRNGSASDQEEKKENESENVGLHFFSLSFLLFLCLLVMSFVGKV